MAITVKLFNFTIIALQYRGLRSIGMVVNIINITNGFIINTIGVVFPGDNETTNDHVLFIKDDDIKPNSERAIYLNLKF